MIWHRHRGGSRRAGMHAGARLTTPIAGAAPWQQHAPDQAYFRAQAAGRNVYPSAPGMPAHANVVAMVRHEDGTQDLVPLEPGDGGWFDLGGPVAGSDFRAGRA